MTIDRGLLASIALTELAGLLGVDAGRAGSPPLLAFRKNATPPPMATRTTNTSTIAIESPREPSREA